MLYNSKWFENFQAYGQLASKNESKKSPPFFTFFHTNVTLWSVATGFFGGAKKRIFVTLNANTSQCTWWKILKFFPHLHNLPYYKILQYMCPKMIFFKKLILVLEMAISECFLWSHSQGTLGVNYMDMIYGSYFTTILWNSLLNYYSKLHFIIHL